MEVKIGPNSLDEPNILYKLQRKIKVFNTNNNLPNRGYNLVSSSSKYGIVFIVAPNSMLSAYYLKDLINKECEASHVTLKLQLEPTHIAVNCDQEWLALISTTMLFVYKIVDFQNQNVLPSFSIKLDVNPSTSISSVHWNPCVSDTIAIAFLDGTLLVSQVNTLQVKKLNSNVRCICWSPKGKQIVTGNNDGTLCQYKPDLSPMKIVPAPNLFEGAGVEALAIFWISTYQFAVVYKNAVDNSRPAVTIVNTPKGGQPSCINYEDICYSMGSSRPWYYYLHGLTQWNMILASSSNSMEIATLGSADGANWLQWCQVDEARPELPLTNKTQENYPVGICINTCAIHQLPWGENETLPPMPLLLVLSQTGLLTIFNIVNLKKESPCICTPLQQLTLPASLMTSIIPDDVVQTAPVAAAAPLSQAMPQQVTQAHTPQHQQPQLSVNQFGGQPFGSNAQPFAMQKSQAPTGIFSQSTPQAFDTKPIETKPQVPVVHNPPSVAPPQPVTTVESPKPQTPIQAQEINALKTEQERVNKMKANEELKNMLIKEVNDFQMELYKFRVKTRESHIKLQKDIESITTDFSIQPKDIEQLKIDCSIEELREAIVQLKLDLVRACAVVAEVRTHNDTKHLLEWSQADPLTTKRVASVKKLAYYVQNQLDQAHRALDHKWNEMSMRNPNKKPGQRMLRPILDDIYQPLVKQQEILGRQQAVLRSLRNTLKECGDVAPVFKTTNILRSTPFRNKGDPLSKLTKNILNMSIEPEKDKSKDQKVINQKLDALRDMLANHKTVKIKPVNIELRQQLTAMRLNYERSLKEKEKAGQEVKVKVEVQSPKVEPAPFVPDVKAQNIKSEAKAVPSITVPTYTPVSNTKAVKPPIANVARTLFTDDESKQESTNVIAGQQQPKQALLPTPIKLEPKEQNNQTVAPTTRILLKGMLQNKSQANAEKSDANTFMGQKICSPNAFNFSGNSAAPSAVFTAKPIADMNNMLSKLQPQTFTAEPKNTIPNPQSSETGEIDTSVQKPPFETKTLTDAITVKPTAPLSQSNVPDVLKTTAQNSNFNKTEAKIKEEALASKENIPTKANEKTTKEPQKLAEDNQPKAFNLSVKSAPSLSNAQQATPISEAVKPELKTETTTSDSVKPVSSIFSGSGAALSGSKPQTVFEGTSAISFSAKTTSGQDKPSETSTASSIFGKAVASQNASSPESKPSSPGSIFASSGSSVFGSSIFGRTTTMATTSTAQSIFSAASTAMTSSIPTTTQSAGEAAGVTTTASSAPISVFSQAQPVSMTPTTTSTTAVTTATTTTSQAVAQDACIAAPIPVFGSTINPTKPVFGSTTTTSSLWSFGTSTQSSIFGTATTTSTQSVFGTAATPSTQASVFGSQTQTPPTQASIFGSQKPTPSTQTSVFGSAIPSTQTSVLGSQTATAPTQASVFGSQTAASTQASIFGSQTPTPSTQAFGSQATTQSTQASIFGSQTTPSTQTSVFGSQTTPSTQASVFGSQSTPSTQALVFGSTTQSVFGSSNTTPFAPSTTQSSLFGNTESMFAAASISTTSAPSPTSGGSIFGTSGGGSMFGDSSTNVFGGKTTFGQSNQSAAAIFGGANSTFKQGNTNFWGGNASSGNAFGSSTFGQQPTTQASLFSGTTGGSFSTPSTGQPLGSPQNAFGATEAKPSVFGSPQQTSPSFGGSPMFGSKPVFGQSTGFGSPTPTSTPSFGGFGGFNKSPSSGFGAPAAFGAPAFGGSAFGGSSPGKMFGGSPTAPGFGSPTQSNSTFENLATQNTLTFGNLAQQSGQQSPPQQPSFNTAPSFTGWRG